MRHSSVTSNESKDYCIFCSTKRAVYYCEDCNLSFCEDCGDSERRTIYICSGCQSKNVECRQRASVNGELYICKDCGSLDIEAQLVVQRSCPSCRSPRVLSIAKKKLILIQQLKEVVDGFKLGYRELKGFLREFRGLRQKTLALRAVGYLHDPVIEQTLLSVYETIRGVSNELLERATQEIDLFRIQMEKFYDYSHWTAADFPQIELLIKQIYEDVTRYQKYVEKILSQPKKEQGMVKSKLNVIRYYKSIYDEYSEHLNLFPGELPVCAFRDIKFAKSTIHSLKKGKGILFLTDQRVIFVRRSGIIFKKIQRIFNFNYTHVLDVTIAGRVFKKLLFIMDQGDLIFSSSRKMMEAILDYLRISVNFGKYRINDEKVLATLDQIQLSTKHLEKQIDKKIVQLVAGSSDDLRGEPLFISQSNNEIIPFYKEDSLSLNSNRMIFKLQSEKFSIEQTLDKLEQKYRSGGLSPDLYIKQFRYLQGELFIIEEKLRSLESQTC